MSGVSAMNAQCPECESSVPIPRASELWDTVICPFCQTELQLISESPPELDYADYDDELDLDDEYDEVDDDDDWEDDYGDLDDEDEDEDY
jgi:hypothetical protein